MMDFPFNRDQYFPIAHLLEFGQQLSNIRQSDLILSNKLREPTSNEFSWVKLWHEELIPLLYCVRHGKISSDATFRIMPNGNPVDLEICHEGNVTRLQFTVADAKWASTKKGSQHHLLVEALNTGEVTSGFGPFRRKNVEVTGRDRALSSADLNRAYGDGLNEALKRKLGKVDPTTILVVYCRNYGHAMDNSRFKGLVQGAMNSCKQNSSTNTWFVDSADEFFVHIKTSKLLL